MSRFRYRGRFRAGVGLFLRILFSYKWHALRTLLCSDSRKEELLRRLHARNARRLRETMVRQRGVFIKIGQFMSSRVDLLPEEYTDELSKLQDRVPPAPFSDIRKRLVEELGPMEEVFSSFDEEPIAAASLGQVHRACLRDGECIVVKVQYPGIEEIIDADMRTVRFVVGITGRIYPHINVDVIYSEFSRIVLEELDYIQEGKNAEAFSRNFARDPRIRIPIVFWPFTTRKVLTLEYLEGIKITELEEIDRQGIDRREVARVLAEAYSQMFFRDGLFHGDPHPGNIFVRPGPEIVLVDFGMVDRIKPPQREGLRKAFTAVVDRDPLGLVRALVDMGFIPLTKDIHGLVQMVERILRKYRDMTPREFMAVDVAEIGADIMDLLRINPAIQIPNDFILFGRVVGMLNGLGSRLDPETNIIEIGAPFAKKFVKDEARRPAVTLAQAAATGRTLAALPKLLRDFLVSTARGETRVEITSGDIVRELRQIRRVSRGFITATLTVGAGAAAVVFRLHQFNAEALGTAIGAAVLLLVTINLMRRS